MKDKKTKIKKINKINFAIPFALSLAILSFLVLIPNVFAAFTVSVSLPTKSLTENNQVTATVTVENPGGSSESNIVVQLAGSPTSWFTTVQDCGVISSIVAGGSQTSTCIIRPTTVGSDLTLTATAQSSGGTTGSGSTGGISVSSSSGSLTASVSAPSSVGLSETFYVSVGVTAPPSTNADNVRTTLSVSGACSIASGSAPASQTLGTVNAGTTESPLNWQITSSTASGTCTATVSVLSDNAGSASPSKSITVGTGGGGGGSDSGTGTGSSSGGGGGAAVGVTLNKTFASIIPETPKVLTSVDLANTSSQFTEISFSVKSRATNVGFSVQGFGYLAKPSDAPSSDPTPKVYRYIKIISTNLPDSNIASAKIKFKVEKSWISQNIINPDLISLFRFADGQWVKLATTKISEDATYTLYEATTPGFSYFVIAAELPGQTIPPAEQPTETTTTAAPPAMPVKIEYWMYAAIAIIIFAVLIVAFKFSRKSKKEKGEAELFYMREER